MSTFYVRTVDHGGSYRTVGCAEFKVTREGDRIEVRCLPTGPSIVLPDDGKAVYIMNSSGTTIDSYRALEGAGGAGKEG